MRRLFLVLILLFIVGCSSLSNSVKTDSGQYQIPVTHEEIEKPAGWENSSTGDMVAKIEVVPREDGKSTIVYVRQKPRSISKKLFPSRKETTLDVISDNPNTTVTQESTIPWWWWTIGITVVLGVLYFLLRKYLGPVWSILKKLKFW